MKPSLLLQLVQFREQVGEGPAGKFLQRLLALAFLRAGHSVDEEHTVEGPDLLVDQFQIEVKTRSAEPFTIQQKDILYIQQALRQGKTPVLALLEFSSLRGWTLVRANGLAEGTYYRRELACRGIPHLENDANQHFAPVAEAWLPELMKDPKTTFHKMDVRRRNGHWRP